MLALVLLLVACGDGVVGPTLEDGTDDAVPGSLAWANNLALPEALAWQDDARLAYAEGWDDEWAVENDLNDGLISTSAGWRLIYTSPSIPGGTLSAVVHGLGIASTAESGFDHGLTPESAIEDWRVDSDALMATIEEDFSPGRYVLMVLIPAAALETFTSNDLFYPPTGLAGEEPVFGVATSPETWVNATTGEVL